MSDCMQLIRLLGHPFGEQLADKEKEEMDKFLVQHAQGYDFSHGETGEMFGLAFKLLVQERFLLQPKQEHQQPRDHRLRVLQCMRVLMRDASHRSFFVDAGGVHVLVSLVSELAQQHFSPSLGDFASEMLVETLSILKRFGSLPSLSSTSRDAGEMKLQRALVALLSTREALVLQCVLVAIYQLVQLEEQMHAIGQLGAAETLLCILTDYEPSFKVLAADLIEVLINERTFYQDLLLHDGVAVMLSLLHSDDSCLPLPLLRSLERLTAQPECAKDIRQLGGINMLLSLISSQSSPQVVVATCAVLTVLALDGEAALQIRKANGVFVLGQLLLHERAGGDGGTEEEPLAKDPLPTGNNSGAASLHADAPVCSSHSAAAHPAPSSQACPESQPKGLLRAGDPIGVVNGASGEVGAYPDEAAVLVTRATSDETSLAAHVFRTLRFIFSTERNRKIFRRLFPPDLFAQFIDIGHFVRELDCYIPLALQLSKLSAEARAKVQEALDDINVVKGSSRHYIKDYAVVELLGKGAFGSVYHVKKDSGETSYAMKELPMEAISALNPETDAAGQEATASSLKREVQILSNLHHPHIIRYYESFQQDSTFYIVMELVEGATLLDHLNSLAEKAESMPEQRVWSIFTQVSLALQYMHREQHVVHRDLTPSNILISVDDIVKVADFGLAKQRLGTNSAMESVVGTVLYQCPELIQHESYGEKADIWSLGCVLYQMAMLKPPFEGGNPLAVARKIVEGTFPPLRETASALLSEVVSRLLCVQPELRPDIDEVARLVSPILMAELGRVSKAEHTLRAEVLIEREWRQRHEREASRNKEAVHRLFARQQLSCSGRSSTRETREASAVWRSRDHGRSPMLSISPSRIREIHDPCSRILNQLHKILFISQLPPSMGGELSAERQVPTWNGL